MRTYTCSGENNLDVNEEIRFTLFESERKQFGETYLYAL